MVCGCVWRTRHDVIIYSIHIALPSTLVCTGTRVLCQGYTLTPGIVPQSYTSHRSFGRGYKALTEVTDVAGTGTEVLQNSQKFRVLWHGRTEPTEIPGRHENVVPVPRLLWHGRTELTEVPGTGMNVIQNLQKFRVRV